MTLPKLHGPLAPAERERLRAMLLHPVLFGRRFLRSVFWPVQEQIMQALITGHRRVAVKACHASGKTYVLARLVLWWVTRFRNSIVVTTAPGWRQVERVIWGEIRNAAQTSRLAFPIKATTLTFGPKNYAIGISTTDASRFSGFRAPNVLVVIDEAQGVKAPIYEAIEGLRAGGDVWVLMSGNPTIPSGPYFDAFTLNRHQWHTITISAFDTPNLEGLLPAQIRTRLGDQTTHDAEVMGYLQRLTPEQLDVAPWPFLTRRRWVLEKWLEWGLPGNPLWDARVMGRFSRQVPGALIPLGWLEDARNRDIPEGLLTLQPKQPDLEVGIDVAGPGEDETSVKVVHPATGTIVADANFLDADARGPVALFLKSWKPRIRLVKIDEIGLGWYFKLHLRDLGFPVAGVNVQHEARDTERFDSLKSELFWALRMRAEVGDLRNLVDSTVSVDGTSRDLTLSQLAGIKYRPNARGQTHIESKQEMRKRGVLKSPDRAEATMLAFAPGFAPEGGGLAIA